MASQHRKAKEDFFNSLNRLDDLSDSDDEAKSSSQPMGPPPPPSEVKARSHRSSASSRTKPSLQKASSSPQVPTAMTSPLTRMSLARTTAPLVPRLKRARSEAAPASAKPKRRVKGKQVSEPVPAQARCFPPEMCLLFVPSRGLTSLQQRQIDEVENHGAQVVWKFTNRVTHVIADSKWTFEQILKELPGEQQPAGVVMVTWDWIVESMLYGLRDPNQTRFLVAGAPSLPGPQQRQTRDQAETSITGSGISVAKRRPAEQSTPTKTINQLPFEPASVTVQEQIADPAAVGEDELDLIQKGMDKNAALLEDLVNDDPSFKFEGNYVSDSSTADLQKGNFSCMNKNEREQVSSNPNHKTILLLKQMADIYASNAGDQWRARAFKQASTALSKQSTLIATKEQAEKLHGIGSSIAPKIEEIVMRGSFGRLDEANSDPMARTRHLFSRIYQVGHAQAASWVAAGYTTLDQLLQHADLTTNQRIGIEHFEDFETRIPRAEVLQHGQIIDRALKSIDTGLQIIIGGSYRRGSPTSGDIDVLITKKGARMEQIQTVVMDSLIPELKQHGFIKVELASGHSSDNETPSKWMGASTLPGQTIWRRLDLLFVPWDELGAALIYWTGNDFFNRSLRLLASRRGMRLNQHGLYKNVLRGQNRMKLTEGELLESHSEEKIFEILGVTYRPPEHRNP